MKKTIILLALLASPVAAESGYLVSIYDGDTMTIQTGSENVIVRLYGVDAPELSQPSGESARALLASLVGSRCTFQPQGRSYGRVVAKVRCDGFDLALTLVTEGLAWVSQRYTSDPTLIRAEKTARQARKGLWRASNPIPPSRWRMK